MKSITTRTLLLAGVAMLAFGGWAMSGHLISTVYAADEHGHGHEHEENEESHDTGGEEHGHAHEEEHGHAGEGIIALTDEQIAASGIKTAQAGSGVLTHEISVPGKIVAAADRMAQVSPKVGGTVTEVRKNLGDPVEPGEILALIESREMAEAVADNLAAQRAEELARTTLNREKDLWERKITAEQDYLNARNAHQEARIRLDLTRQKLRALGHDGSSNARFHELKSPIKGRIISRELTLGEYVDPNHAAFSVADLSVVWVETALTSGDLSYVREGQSAVISGGGGKTAGKIIFISPAIDPETRAAKAIIALDNADGQWRAGDIATAAIATASQEAGVTVPKDAVQTIEGKPVLFVRTDKGFEKREVVVGKADSAHIEILSGITPGETIATANSFTLKAELGKAEAEHSH